MNTAVWKKQPLRKRLFPALLHRLRWIGVSVHPFIVVREGEASVSLDKSVGRYDFGLLSEADLEELILLEPGSDREKLQRWFRQGKLCFGLRDESRLIAKMWCDIDEFNFVPMHRRLSSDEAYLYSAYTDPDYRGQGVAPVIRTGAYAYLHKMGRSRFYSYCDYFNSAARRFKAKLGAREESLRMHVCLFGKWSGTVTLRRLG